MQSNPSPRVAHPRAHRYDLHYRPDSYLTPSDPAEAILARAAGWSPAPGHVTIATVQFGAPGTIGEAAPHVVAIQAMPRGNHFAYRIVDDFGSVFRAFHPVSSEPLMLGAVAELIEESERCSVGEAPGEGECGVLIPVLDRVFGFASGRDARKETTAARSALVDAVRAYVRVESEFYPGLSRYFEERVDEWLAAVGCLPAVPYRARAEGRFDSTGVKPGPSPSRVPPSSSVAGPHATWIDRVVRAWWRSQEIPLDLDSALDLGRNAARLRSALRREVSRSGRRPGGLFVVGSGPDGFAVDLGDLADEIG
jgi:hypothetical protein